MTGMPTRERSEPAINAAERPMLEGWLDHHRDTLALKCAGLTDAQLREASVPPSELSLLGLVRHMAEVERGWFREVLAGEDVKPIYGTDEDRDGEFHLTEADTWEKDAAIWQAEIARARENTANIGLDDLSVGRSRNAEQCKSRRIYTHMIEEYARHISSGRRSTARPATDPAQGPPRRRRKADPARPAPGLRPAPGPLPWEHRLPDVALTGGHSCGPIMTSPLPRCAARTAELPRCNEPESPCSSWSGWQSLPCPAACPWSPSRALRPGPRPAGPSRTWPPRSSGHRSGTRWRPCPARSPQRRRPARPSAPPRRPAAARRALRSRDSIRV